MCPLEVAESSLCSLVIPRCAAEFPVNLDLVAEHALTRCECINVWVWPDFMSGAGKYVNILKQYLPATLNAKILVVQKPPFLTQLWQIYIKFVSKHRTPMSLECEFLGCIPPPCYSLQSHWGMIPLDLQRCALSLVSLWSEWWRWEWSTSYTSW